MSGTTPQLLVNVDVDDLGRAVGFYTQAFNLKIGRSFGAVGVELVGAIVPIYLLHKPPGSVPVPGEPRRRRNYARHWTPMHLDFVVDDIQAGMERALHAGANLDQPMQTHKWGHVAMMSDPFGNGFCLLEFIGDGYDAIADTAGD